MIVTVTPNPVLDRTLTVREIVIDEMTRATTIREDWGGKGFNVSRALRALGEESVAMGFIGGAIGHKLEAGLRGLGVVTDLTSIVGETRTNIVITEAESGRYIKVNESGPTVQEVEMRVFFERVRAQVHPGDMWALCGSLPPGIPLDFYAQLIDLVQSRGAKAFLDASGESLRLGVLARPYLIKPNAVEAVALTGRVIKSESDVLASAEVFLSQGAQKVALSLGADGLLLASKDAKIRAYPPQVHVQNPTGAGDALLAGLIHALNEGLSLTDVACWGVASGTAAAMREGVSVGTLAEVKSLLAQVIVK